jgi:hypothetical protein
VEDFVLRNRLALAVGIASLLSAVSAFAVDGVIEINQASVLANGGFPFVANGGSHRLTGNLTVPGGNTTAIQLTGGSLDLNGLTIAGFGNVGIAGMGGAGIKHVNAGGTHSRINDNFVTRNVGVAIDAYGSYSSNSIYDNAGPNQVIGGVADAGGNSTN